MVHANNIYTALRDAGAGGRGPSHRVWEKVGTSSNPDGGYGWIAFEDDFEGNNALASTGTFGKGPWYGFVENSGAVAKVATEIGGVIRLTTGATADNDMGITLGQVAGLVKVGVGSPGSVTATGGKVLFETRIRRVGSVADGECSFFAGLTEEARAVDNGFFTDAHAVAAIDLLGFWTTDADGDSLKFGYNVASGTAQVVGSKAIAADTWYKVGFVYDPAAVPAKRIKWYVDGVEQSTYVTATNIAASTFPGGEVLTPSFDIKTDNSAAEAMDADWVKVAMEGLS